MKHNVEKYSQNFQIGNIDPNQRQYQSTHKLNSSNQVNANTINKYKN